MSANPDTRGSVHDGEVLLAAFGAAALGYALWSRRGDALAALGAAGLADPDRGAGWHLNFGGWSLAVLAALAVYGAARCALWAAAWRRWTAGHRTGAVPAVPVGPLLSAVGFAVLLVVWVSAGLGWGLLAMLAALAAGAATGPHAARHWRQAAVFGQQADAVLGHGHPGRAAVRATDWRRGVSAARWEDYPGRIEAAVGPGWRGSPAELAELARLARDTWPGYNSPGRWRSWCWDTDQARRVVVGLIEPDGGH